MGHITVLLDRLDARDDRDWYAARAADEGWSRAVLEHKIAARLRAAVGSAPSNFAETAGPRDPVRRGSPPIPPRLNWPSSRPTVPA